MYGVDTTVSSLSSIDTPVRSTSPKHQPDIATITRTDKKMPKPSPSSNDGVFARISQHMLSDACLIFNLSARLPQLVFTRILFCNGSNTFAL